MASQKWTELTRATSVASLSGALLRIVDGIDTGGSPDLNQGNDRGVNLQDFANIIKPGVFSGSIAPGTLRLADDANSQALEWYHLDTDGANYARGLLKHDGVYAFLGAESAGAGGAQPKVSVGDPAKAGMHFYQYLDNTLGFLRDASANQVLQWRFNALKPAGSQIGVYSLGEPGTPFGALHITPPASVTPTRNSEMTVEATSNTTLTFKLKGTDGVVRNVALNLS